MAAYTIFIGMLVLLAAVITSWRNGEIAGSNPWGAQTLEWMTPTPVPLENFEVLPVVTANPYQYGIKQETSS
jgi:cytochrome c oxidase subunit 1